MRQGFWKWITPVLAYVLGVSAPGSAFEADPKSSLNNHSDSVDTSPPPGSSKPADGVHPDSLTPGIYLSFPPCIPNCTLADRDRLMADTSTENKILNAIAAARRSIDFSTFTFNRPRILAALIAAANRGIRVRGIVDRSQFASIGQACTPFRCTFGAPFNTAEFLAKSPVERFALAEKNKLWPKQTSDTEKLAVVVSGLRNGSAVTPGPRGRLVHNKLLLVDREILINGSPNFSTTGLAINLESLEFATRQSDPAMLHAFICMLDTLSQGAEQHGQKALQRCETPRIYFTPAPRNRGAMGRILSAVNAARQTIDISMHHFSSQEVAQALKNARRRGVFVRMLFDDDDCVVKTPDEIRELMKSGVKTRYLQTNCDMFQLMHTKFGIFDGKLVINGPANWTQAGMITNYENFIVYEDRKYVHAFSAFFDRAWTLAQSRQTCGCNPSEPACRKRFCLDRQLPH